TGPKRLPMPISSIAAVPMAASPPCPIAPRPRSPSCPGPLPSPGLPGRVPVIVIRRLRASHRAAVVRHIVVHRDRPGDDVRLGLLDRRLHLLGDERGIVLVERPVEAILGKAEILYPRLPGSVLRLHEG